MNTKSNKKSVVLWIFIFLMVAGLAGCYGIYRWAKNAGPEFEEVIRSGQEFGQQTDENNCLEHTLTSLDECESFSCSLKNSTFFTACLGQAEPSENFCEYAPGDAGINEQVKWGSARCKQLNREDDMCIQLMSFINTHCHSENRQAKTLLFSDN